MFNSALIYYFLNAEFTIYFSEEVKVRKSDEGEKGRGVMYCQKLGLTLIFTVYGIWVSKSQLHWASGSSANTCFLVLLRWTFSGHPTFISPFFEKAA